MTLSIKKPKNLLPTASAGAPLLAAMIATNRFNTAKTNKIIPNTFIAFTFKGFVMFVIYPLCGKPGKVNKDRILVIKFC